METSDINYTDTHCHLYASEFEADRTQAVEKAINAGVSKIMLPNIDESTINGMQKLAEHYPGHCYPMMGLHPCSVKEDYKEILERLKPALKTERYTGIGETGVDLYWDTTFKDLQIKSFEEQISWALEYDLPVIIHSRESLELNIQIIRHHQNGKLKGIFHCFTGTVEEAKEITELGFKVGIGGVVTFKNSGLFNILSGIPPESVVLETDAPYLAPAPYRGKRNEPSYLIIIAGRVAEGMGMTMERLSMLTNANAEEVFGKLD